MEGVSVRCPTHGLDCLTCCVVAKKEFDALTAKLRQVEGERDAYKKAKMENDERFMLERDAAREEASRYKAALEKIAARRAMTPDQVTAKEARRQESKDRKGE